MASAGFATQDSQASVGSKPDAEAKKAAKAAEKAAKEAAKAERVSAAGYGLCRGECRSGTLLAL